MVINISKNVPNRNAIRCSIVNKNKTRKENVMDELNGLLVGIPQAVANLQLPDPLLRDFYRNEQNRVYYLNDVIGAESLDLARYIIECNREDKGVAVEDRKPILVMIDSPGGAVEVLASLMGAIRISKTPVWTCVYCTAYSAAADLLACGHKRFALPNTSIMAHAGSATYSGTQAQVEQAKKFYDAMGKRVNDEVKEHTQMDDKIARKIKAGDFYMNEEEALKYGFIDRIIEDIDEIL